MILLLTKVKPTHVVQVVIARQVTSNRTNHLPTITAISKLVGRVCSTSTNNILSYRLSDGFKSCQTSPYGNRCRMLYTTTAADTIHDESDDEPFLESDDTPNNENRNNLQWESMFEALKDYKAMHGDTFVPKRYPKDPKLGNFVDNSRQLYRMRFEVEMHGKEADTTDLNRNLHIQMSDKRIEKLNSIGFVWNLHDHVWNIRYEELKEYAAKHGDCLVPIDYEENISLPIWVAKQRRNYQVRLHNESMEEEADKASGYEMILSDDRIQKLDGLGFTWEVHEDAWFERYEELRLYRKNHGDALVPKQYSHNGISLGRWVDQQRLHYKIYQKRMELEEKWKGNEHLMDVETKKEMEKFTRMNQERLNLLEAEGFIWNVPEYKWRLRFEELCVYVEINGHALIREKPGGKYDPLARWVSLQRINYQKIQDGERSPLTEKRITMLESIGFIWHTEQTKMISQDN